MLSLMHSRKDEKQSWVPTTTVRGLKLARHLHVAAQQQFRKAVRQLAHGVLVDVHAGLVVVKYIESRLVTALLCNTAKPASTATSLSFVESCRQRLKAHMQLCSADLNARSQPIGTIAESLHSNSNSHSAMSTGGSPGYRPMSNSVCRVTVSTAPPAGHLIRLPYYQRSLIATNRNRLNQVRQLLIRTVLIPSCSRMQEAEPKGSSPCKKSVG